MFRKNCQYRHSLPYTTLGISVVSVLHRNSERVKLKIRYFNLKTGRSQYTGKGNDQHTDTVRILIKDIKNWRLA